MCLNKIYHQKKKIFLRTMSGNGGGSGYFFLISIEITKGFLIEFQCNFSPRECQIKHQSPIQIQS